MNMLWMWLVMRFPVWRVVSRPALQNRRHQRLRLPHVTGIDSARGLCCGLLFLARDLMVRTLRKLVLGTQIPFNFWNQWLSRQLVLLVSQKNWEHCKVTIGFCFLGSGGPCRVPGWGEFQSGDGTEPLRINHRPVRVDGVSDAWPIMASGVVFHHVSHRKIQAQKHLYNFIHMYTVWIPCVSSRQVLWCSHDQSLVVVFVQVLNETSGIEGGCIAIAVGFPSWRVYNYELCYHWMQMHVFHM